MILKVFKTKPEPKPEKEVYLRLTENGFGCIELHAYDEKGNKLRLGKILEIGSDGVIRLYFGLNQSLGFQLDENGRIKIK